MSPTVKYKDFLHRKVAGNYITAGDTLLKILGNRNMAPRWFWLYILFDALPLLEHPDMVFGLDQVVARVVREKATKCWDENA